MRRYRSVHGEESGRTTTARRSVFRRLFPPYRPARIDENPARLVRGAYIIIYNTSVPAHTGLLFCRESDRNRRLAWKRFVRNTERRVVRVRHVITYYEALTRRKACTGSLRINITSEPQWTTYGGYCFTALARTPRHII